MSAVMPDLWQTNCVHCGRAFIAARKDKKFCSVSCKVANYQMRKRDPLGKITKKLKDDLKG
tara:strand:- start:172 stop:354 length:183 start_codon:yes stop_codon:yes gene_type:complete